MYSSSTQPSVPQEPLLPPSSQILDYRQCLTQKVCTQLREVMDNEDEEQLQRWMQYIKTETGRPLALAWTDVRTFHLIAESPSARFPLLFSLLVLTSWEEGYRALVQDCESDEGWTNLHSDTEVDLPMMLIEQSQEDPASWQHREVIRLLQAGYPLRQRALVSPINGETRKVRSAAGLAAAQGNETVLRLCLQNYTLEQWELEQDVLRQGIQSGHHGTRRSPEELARLARVLDETQTRFEQEALRAVLPTDAGQVNRPTPRL